MRNLRILQVFSGSLRLLSVLLLFSSCASLRLPDAGFDPGQAPPAPDYSRLETWAAHPLKEDPSDQSPDPKRFPVADSGFVDVFFLHPTSFLEVRKRDRAWNASCADPKVNQRTDRASIRYQASAFNGVGPVYAPRYRQAHYMSFFTSDRASARQALDLAYSDVRAAFRYYLDHWNQGRPFVLASHSQGANHALRLLREEIQDSPLRERLVVTYLLGWPVNRNDLTGIPPCQDEEDLQCFCSWRTYERKAGKKLTSPAGVICTNPISWKLNDQLVDKSEHKGAVLKNFTKVLPNICDAQVHQGWLLVSKPRFPGSFLLRRKNYHAGDLNFFYVDVRENVEGRVKEFQRAAKQ